MTFGEILLEILRPSTFALNLLSVYIAISLVVSAHKVFISTGRDDTARLLLLTFSSLLLQSAFTAITYGVALFTDYDTHQLSNLKNFIAQMFVLLSMVGFQQLRLGRSLNGKQNRPDSRD